MSFSVGLKKREVISMQEIKVLILGVLIAFGGQTFAQSNSALTGAAAQSLRQNALAERHANTEEVSTASEAVREEINTAPTSDSVNQSASKGKSSQGAGQMMNMLAAAALMAACAASCPKCQMELCAMGALAAAQGAHDGDAANQSADSYKASQYKSHALNPAAVPGSGEAAYTDPQIAEGMNKLKDAGYKVTEKGVTFPDGTFQPASAFNSGSSMLAAGMDPDAAAAADNVMKKINKELSQYSVSSMAVDSAGGSGSGGGGGSYGSSDYSSFKMPKFKSPFANQDSKKLLAGKSVMVGGEPIGVKGDNLFDMVHRAYQKKRNRRQFMESSKSGRLPASMTEEGL